ncbi:MAG: hydrogenase iron-sulfur subunit [Desulfobacteraceae bacterium]
MSYPKIGAVICDCQGEVSAKIEIPLLEKHVRELESVEHIEHVPALCSEAYLPAVFESFVQKGVEAILFIACSPRSSLKFPEQRIQSLINLYGFDKSMFEAANIREQVAWMYERGEESFGKALDQVRMAHAALLNAVPSLQDVGLEQKVLVAGGGPAGLEAARSMAMAGIRAILVEKNTYLGGRLPQIRILFQSETWNGKCLSQCVGPVHANNTVCEPGVSAFVNSSIQQIEKRNGNFHAVIKKGPEYVDPDKCISCGKCAEVCPEYTVSGFEEGLYTRKAVDKDFPMAVPDAYNIIKSACTECGECVAVCPADAIDLNAAEQTFEESFGAVFLSTGFDADSTDAFPEYGGKLPDVVTGMGFERVIDNGLKRPSDAGRPDHIVFVLCAGSRATGDKLAQGVPYCSKTCCATTMKQAIQVSNMMPEAEITIVYYYDIRTYERTFEALYDTVKKMGVEFVQGNLASIEERAGSGLTVRLEQLGEQNTSSMEEYEYDEEGKLEIEADMVVLASAQTPKRESSGLVEQLKIPVDKSGFPMENQPRIFRPTESFVDRVFVAGSASGPKVVQQAVEQGRAAAMNLVPQMLKRKKSVSEFASRIDRDTCVACRICETVCPHGAVSLTDEGIEVDPAFCQGCGLCQAACPTHAANLANFSERQILAQVDAAFGSLKPGEPRILGLLCYWCSYSAADFAAKTQNRLPVNLRVIRIRCSSSVHTSLLFEMFKRGVDGIIIGGCPPSSCHHLHGNYLADRRTHVAARLMDQMGLDTSRLVYDYMGVSNSDMLARHANNMDGKLRELGPNPVGLQYATGEANER